MRRGSYLNWQLTTTATAVAKGVGCYGRQCMVTRLSRHSRICRDVVHKITRRTQVLAFDLKTNFEPG